jgi:hypothetical protein
MHLKIITFELLTKFVISIISFRCVCIIQSCFYYLTNCRISSSFCEWNSFTTMISLSITTNEADHPWFMHSTDFAMILDQFLDLSLIFMLQIWKWTNDWHVRLARFRIMYVFIDATIRIERITCLIVFVALLFRNSFKYCLFALLLHSLFNKSSVNFRCFVSTELLDAWQSKPLCGFWTMTFLFFSFMSHCQGSQNFSFRFWLLGSIGLIDFESGLVRSQNT